MMIQMKVTNLENDQKPIYFHFGVIMEDDDDDGDDDDDDDDDDADKSHEFPVCSVYDY